MWLSAATAGHEQKRQQDRCSAECEQEAEDKDISGPQRECPDRSRPWRWAKNDRHDRLRLDQGIEDNATGVQAESSNGKELQPARTRPTPAGSSLSRLNKESSSTTGGPIVLRRLT
jgi:hypothetical protein